MTFVGWIQVLVFFALILAVTKPIGAYMFRVFEGGDAPLGRGLGRIENALLSPVRRRSAAGAGLESVHVRAAGVQHLRRDRDLRDPAAAGAPAPQPAALRRRAARARLQHGRQLHHQHQLAGLQRRVDDELPDPDGGSGLAQLHLGRGRDLRGPGGRARLHQARRPRGRQAAGELLGRSQPRDPLRAPAAQLHLRAGAGLAGGDPEPQTVPRRHHAGRRQADAGARPGRVAGGDQAARHQRRRLLQRQLGPSVREPDAVHQPHLAVPHLHDPGGADLHLRPDGQGLQAGVGAAGRDERALLRRRRRLLPRRNRRATARSRACPFTRRSATWRGRRRASASPPPRSTRRSPPTPPAAR